MGYLKELHPSWLLAFLQNIRLELKHLKMTSTLAYYIRVQILLHRP